MQTLPLLVALSVVLGVATASAAEPSDLVARGKHVFEAAGCVECHTATKPDSPMLAGGRALKTPFGTFYTPNITPDPVHGIGRWSDEDFIRALRYGVSPSGASYFPVFPYTSYTAMRDEDMRALKAYIFSLPPVPQANHPHEIKFPFGWRPLMVLWKWLFFESGPFKPDPAHDATWNRGAYLANALGHCQECHTPRNFLGARETGMAFAGTAVGPEGGRVPNITPDPKTGIGGWTADDLDSLFTMGMLPSGDFVGDGMADVVTNSTSRLTADDRKALTDYLKSLPPIDHNVSSSSAN